tara:strand:- start:717 stop:1532 length:816 start_codon:yes stop_codon:yes gene_type:complete
MIYSLSVVIVNFNTGKYLFECLESIKKTTNDLSDPKIQVVVVDNASTDGSAKNIKAIKNKENIGFARAVNQGLKKARGEYVLLLNPDTKVKPKALKNILEFAQRHAEAGVIGAQLLNSDGSMQKSVMPFPTVQRAIAEFWLGRKVYSKYAPPGDLPVEVDAVVGAAFLITPTARQKIGGFDEHYFMYFEDLDYCRRAKDSGLKIYYLPTSQIIHHHGVSGQGTVTEKDQWRRLVPSSKIYHGLIWHHLINFVLWSGQVWSRRKVKDFFIKY